MHAAPDTDSLLPPPPARPIRFFFRGENVTVDGPHPTRTVLQWLREDAHCTGTKEGCNEGDCGACTVVVGALDATGEALKLDTVNACIRFLPTLDGRALFTVEDLKTVAGGGALHPVQQALVDCHGSQCGFCTPGFAMSLWHTYEHHTACASRPTRQQLADDLAGNLCRCTGYRPILDAGERMFDLPAAPLDPAPAVAALQALRSADGLHYAAPNADGRVDHFHAPVSLDAFAALREQQPAARVVAGTTDVALWVNKQFRDVGDLLFTGNVAELRRLEARADGSLWIGAAVSLEDAWRAIAQRVPALTEVWLRFASPPVRHAGTLGGNVANGSPIGDGPPVLMALGAQVELRRGSRVRALALEDFYLDYMKNALEPGEFVQALVVPALAEGAAVRAYKVSKRFDSDISALCGAFALRLADDGTVGDVRLVFGGMAATVRRAALAEAALVGRVWDEAAVRDAVAALARDFTPLSDMRSSAAYRIKVAGNLLRRFWLETRVSDPLEATQVTVWAGRSHAPV